MGSDQTEKQLLAGHCCGCSNITTVPYVPECDTSYINPIRFVEVPAAAPLLDLEQPVGIIDQVCHYPGRVKEVFIINADHPGIDEILARNRREAAVRVAKVLPHQQERRSKKAKAKEKRKLK